MTKNLSHQIPLPTVFYDMAVRGLSIAFGKPDYRLSDNFIDLLPGIAARIFVSTSLPIDEIRDSLSFNCLNQME